MTAIRPTLDVAQRVSAELSAALEIFVADPDRDAPPTLEDVRAALRRRAAPGERETELLHPQDRDSRLVELDALIEEFGGEALAADFVVALASEGLSRVIEAVASDRNRSRQPTLGMVRAAMADGLTAGLIGDGALDEDDEGTLAAEIDELIRRHGEDALAEAFVRYE